MKQCCRWALGWDVGRQGGGVTDGELAGVDDVGHGSGDTLVVTLSTYCNMTARVMGLQQGVGLGDASDI